MDIVVLGKKINTKEIFDIQEVEQEKTFFIVREAGFIVHLIDKQPIIFSQVIPFNSYKSEIDAIKKDWATLQNEVYEKWQKDKSELEFFNLKK